MWFGYVSNHVQRGTKLKALAVRISEHSKNDHSSSLADLELLLRVPDRSQRVMDSGRFSQIPEHQREIEEVD